MPSGFSRYFVALVAGLLLVAAHVEVEHLPSRVSDGPMLVETEDSERLLEEGRAHLYDFRLDAAEALFSQLSERADGRVAGTYHLAMATLFKGLITDEEKHFEAFNERYDALNDALSSAPRSTWRTYLEGEARFMRTIAYVKMDRNVRAAMSARSAYSRFRSAADAGGSFYEPYKALGVFHIVFGSLPSGYQRLLSILGYRGTIEQGLEELQQAAEHSRFNHVEARAMLGLFDILVNNEPARGVGYLEALHEEFPESPFFGFLLAYGMIENRDAPRAEVLSREAVDRSRQPEYFFIDYAEYYLAESLFFQNRFEEAETYYRRYIARHRGPALKAPANLHLALSLEMQGRRQDALVFFERVRALRDYDADLHAERHARRHMDAAMSSTERQLVLARNLFYGGDDAESYALFQTLLRNENATETEAAAALYYQGRIHFAEERYRQARTNFARVMQQAGEAAFGFAPWSQYYIGRILHAEGRHGEARNAYEASLEYRGPFDYHQWLEQVVASALEELDARA